MKRRIVLLALVLIFAVSLLAGCGQAATEKPAATAAAPADSAAAPAASGEKETLSFWISFPPNLSKYMQDYNEHRVFKKAEELTGVHIKFVQVSPDSERENFNLMVTAGDYPDMIGNVEMSYSGGAEKAMQDNFIIDVKPLLDANAPNLMKIAKDDANILKNITTGTGAIMGIPQISINVDGPKEGPIVRKDWLDDLGLKLPVTYDDYHTMLKAFKDKKGAVEPLQMAANLVPNSNCLISGYGVAGTFATFPMKLDPYFQVDGKVKYGFIEPGFKEYLTMVNQWYKEGLFSKDCITKYQNPMDPQVEQGIVTGKHGLWYNDAMLMSTWAKKATDKNFHAVAIPDAVKTAGDKLHLGNLIEKTGTMGLWSITSTCKNPALAVKWLDFWLSDEGARLSNYGIEGDTFTIVDGKPQFTDKVVNNPDMDIMSSTIVNTYANMPTFDDQHKLYSSYTEEQRTARGIWGTNKDGAYDMPGALKLTSEEGDKLNLMYSDISTYVKEMLPKFVFGQEPISNFDAFVAKLKAMKIEECIKIKQASLDRYLGK